MNIKEDLHFPIHKSFVFRFIAIYTFLVFVFFSLSTYWSHHREKRQIELQFSKLANAIAVNVSLQLSSIDLSQIQTNQDTQKPEFKQSRKILARARQLNQLAEDQIYIIRKKDEKESDIYEFVVMLQQKTFIADIYKPPRRVNTLYEKAWKGKYQKTPMFTDDHGTFISALAPIFDSRGEVIGLLEVDRNLEEYLEETRSEFKFNITLNLFFILMLIMLGKVMYNSLQKQISHLLSGTSAIHQQIYTHRIPIISADEFATLARALNLALQNLAERFEMLKFIPQHTSKMIQAAIDHEKGVDLSLGRRVEIAVMETDIRGFTSLAENLSPEDTIHLVNHYISAQGELILQYDGSIDKYMGDAVLVVFEGENKEKRAIECALQIQKKIHTLNTENIDTLSQKVEIGIGVSLGEVVMGNMGCIDRMEHTVIGATVNLAARLCSSAKRGEVVLQKELDQENMFDDHNEKIQVKGFSESISIVRLSKEDIIHIKL